MHWNNGKFHENITVGQKVYITDHKHVAIFGTKDYTGFGESTVNTNMYGKDIDIIADNKFFADSNAGSNLWSKQYIHIESGSGTPNHGSENGLGIEIVSKNGAAVFKSESEDYGVDIVSLKNNVNIIGNKYINLNGNNGITVGHASYGTTVPSSGIEGQVFFRLIS